MTDEEKKLKNWSFRFGCSTDPIFEIVVDAKKARCNGVVFEDDYDLLFDVLLKMYRRPLYQLLDFVVDLDPKFVNKLLQSGWIYSSGTDKYRMGSMFGLAGYSTIEAMKWFRYRDTKH